MDLSCILVSICLFCSMFPISLAAKPDNHANDLTIQQIHDECLPESGDLLSSLGLFPPNPNGQSLDTPSAASPFLPNAELSAEQPPITAAEQNLCLQSGTSSDIEDGEELLPRGQQDNIGRMETRTQALDLGWTFLRLTFQALLLMVICHFQAPSTSASPSTSTSTSPLSSSSMRFHVIGAAMLIGFAFTMIGMSLRNAYPTAASIGEHTGMFSAAFAFLVMTGILLPDRLNWSVLPVAGVVLFLGFVFVLANIRQR